MPDIQEVKNLVVPPPEIWQLNNGTTVYETNLGTQEIVKLDLVFLAGRPYEQKRLASRATAALLKDGTTKHTSAEIAESLDFYGATLATPVGLDFATVQLYTLSKHFASMLPLVAEILACPVFPQKELDSFVQRNKQRMQVDLKKNDFVAYRKFTELLFGNDHPYGYNSYPETYDALNRQDLLDHFHETYTTGNCTIFLAGKIEPSVRQLLQEHLSPALHPGERKTANLPPAHRTPISFREPLPDSVQKAIRIGSPWFNRQHDDYEGMYVLNTILGGYFGSRLMANIREKKGYTYNIYSTHDALLHDGYFYVGTEVSNDLVEPTIKEIYLEMEKLQDKPVRKPEMEMVRNYLLGNLLTNLDGAFNIEEVVKTFITEGMSLGDFDELVRVIKTITPKELRELARKYFRKELMWEVVV
ncbi:MAG: pitrilysin family protein [Bacteroidota bacterium]